MQTESSVMLQACMNGGRQKAEATNVPVSHRELALDAASLLRAGAQQFHIHPRSPAGEETLEPDHITNCLRQFRAAVGNAPIGVGTGTWIEPDSLKCLDLINSWRELPDYASVNIGENDAEEKIEILLSKGVGIEAGIWNSKDAERFIKFSDRNRCLRILIEMTSSQPEFAELEYHLVLTILLEAQIDLPVLLHGEEGSAWPMLKLAKEHGHDMRMGFEDCLSMPDGRPAHNNIQMIREASRIMAL